MNSFHEYAYVERHADVDRLKRLWYPIEGAEVQDLVAAALAHFKLPKVTVLLTAHQPDNGLYDWHTRPPSIVLGRAPVVEAVIHELAHHWCHSQLGGSHREYRPGRRNVMHGWDFVNGIDRLARWAEENGWHNAKNPGA